MSENATVPIRCWRGSLSSCAPATASGWSGPTASGKTTLLRILAGKDDADAGLCQHHPTAHLGYLEQQPYFEPGRTLHDEARSALADLLSLQHEAEEVAREMGETTDRPSRSGFRAVRSPQHELHRQDAYNLDHRIEQVLDACVSAARRSTSRSLRSAAASRTA